MSLKGKFVKNEFDFLKDKFNTKIELVYLKDEFNRKSKFVF